jgi:CheY-like chemotaxis protein
VTDQGTRFEQPPQSPGTPALGRVLVVEDLLPVADMIRDVLGSLGYDSAASPNGRDALRRVPLYRPDVVLLDLDLPGMTGSEVLRAMREQYPDVPVVMVTGNQNERAAEATLARGAFDYVRKPFEIEVLGRILQAAVVYRAR